MNGNSHMSGDADMIVAVGHKVDFRFSDGKPLIQRIEDAFKEAVASKLDGKVPEYIGLELKSADKKYSTILTYLIQDTVATGTKTTVKIPIGQAKPDQNVYYAGINGGEYEEYSSLEDIGNDAAEVFKHDYMVDVIGI